MQKNRSHNALTLAHTGILIVLRYRDLTIRFGVIQMNSLSLIHGIVRLVFEMPPYHDDDEIDTSLLP